jgi:hypothetical protein
MEYLVLTIAVVVVSVGLLAFRSRLKPAVFRWGALGLVTGFAIGFVAAFLLGAGHWFGWFEIAVPVFKFGDIAFSGPLWIPATTGLGGLLIGAAVALLKA